MKRKSENLITWKIKYSCNEGYLDLIKQYNSLLKFTYNRVSENPSIKTSDLNALQKSLINCDSMNSWFRSSAEYSARGMIKSNPEGKAIFGGKRLFIDRCQHKITAEEFKIKKLVPLYSIGEANCNGNRMFQMLANETVLFKPSKNRHYVLKLESLGKDRQKYFDKLLEIQNNCLAPISYGLDKDYVYITFDFNLLKQYRYSTKQNRVFAIDMNPNSIGWSVVDWKYESKYHVVQSGTISLKPLNDYRDSKRVSSSDSIHKYVTNKRKHEVVEISKKLFALCKHYKCEVFAIEDLDLVLQDNKNGKKYNRLVNNMWNRKLLEAQIAKRVKASSTELVKVQPQWNSYIGNLVFRKEKLPDECLASIEIGRRGFEFSTQYIFKRRPHKKVVIYPDLKLVKNQLSISLEEIGIDVPSLDDWMSILHKVKESKTKYRFSSSDARNQHSERLFSKFYRERFCLIYEYL